MSHIINYFSQQQCLHPGVQIVQTAIIDGDQNLAPEIGAMIDSGIKGLAIEVVQEKGVIHKDIRPDTKFTMKDTQKDIMTIEIDLGLEINTNRKKTIVTERDLVVVVVEAEMRDRWVALVGCKVGNMMIMASKISLCK